jgi:hypothetical protein
VNCVSHSNPQHVVFEYATYNTEEAIAKGILKALLGLTLALPQP